MDEPLDGVNSVTYGSKRPKSLPPPAKVEINNCGRVEREYVPQRPRFGTFIARINAMER